MSTTKRKATNTGERLPMSKFVLWLSILVTSLCAARTGGWALAIQAHPEWVTEHIGKMLVMSLIGFFAAGVVMVCVNVRERSQEETLMRILNNELTVAKMLLDAHDKSDLQAELASMRKTVARNLIAQTIDAGMSPSWFNHEVVGPWYNPIVDRQRAEAKKIFDRLFGSTVREVLKTPNSCTRTANGLTVRPNSAWERWFLTTYRNLSTDAVADSDNTAPSASQAS